jgi:hypothetical protein
MPRLRPVQWVIHSPIMLLPLLAALVIQTPVEGRGGSLTLSASGLMLQHHGVWLAVALGLGIWVGWHTAIDRPHSKEPDAP